MIDTVEAHREALENVASSDLPAAEIAEALLDLSEQEA